MLRSLHINSHQAKCPLPCWAIEIKHYVYTFDTFVDVVVYIRSFISHHVADVTDSSFECNFHLGRRSSRNELIDRSSLHVSPTTILVSITYGPSVMDPWTPTSTVRDSGLGRAWKFHGISRSVYRKRHASVPVPSRLTVSRRCPLIITRTNERAGRAPRVFQQQVVGSTHPNARHFIERWSITWLKSETRMKDVAVWDCHGAIIFVGVLRFINLRRCKYTSFEYAVLWSRDIPIDCRWHSSVNQHLDFKSIISTGLSSGESSAFEKRWARRWLQSKIYEIRWSTKYTGLAVMRLRNHANDILATVTKIYSITYILRLWPRNVW